MRLMEKVQLVWTVIATSINSHHVTAPSISLHDESDGGSGYIKAKIRRMSCRVMIHLKILDMLDAFQ